MKIHNLGLPRIGEKRELKFTLEKYWRGEIDSTELEQVAKDIRLTNLERQVLNSLDLITVGDFSLYDQVLDHTVMFGNIPSRFRHLESYEQYFAIARGVSEDSNNIVASEMQKWFNTNYHYIVPEFSENREFYLNSSKLIGEIKEAIEYGIDITSIKPVIIGPITYLWLGGDRDLKCLKNLSLEYKKLFLELTKFGIEWVQIDEPILALDRLEDRFLEAFTSIYNNIDSKLKIILTTYFESVEENLHIIEKLTIDVLHIDICDTYSEDLKYFDQIAKHISKKTTLSLGVISGRNIWLGDFDNIVKFIKDRSFSDKVEWIAPSCSLLHLPVTTTKEKMLLEKGFTFLSFAYQKLEELSVIRDQIIGIGRAEDLIQNREALANLLRLRKDRVHREIYNRDSYRNSDYSRRKELQENEFDLGLYPSTTIGSFPQTAALRKIRYRYKKGVIAQSEYESYIKEEIKKNISIQEELGLDVLVHGEPERNDMVEYFAELLEGYLSTEYGWVQSYGSRCVKPSIIYKDIKRDKHMTVDWISYASSLTERPVKGMLTGPITMLKWAFVRQDISYVRVAEQLAHIINLEVKDLIDTGIKIIQIDEAALKEALPLKKRDSEQYQRDAARVFRLCSMDISDKIQIHTHMCYSDFNDILECLKLMDFDVITIETTRSKMKILEQFMDYNISGDIGPGVYDIHSLNIPSEDDIVDLISIAKKSISEKRLWINPDCGLKTRNWEEVIPALSNMVSVTKRLRK